MTSAQFLSETTTSAVLEFSGAEKPCFYTFSKMPGPVVSKGFKIPIHERISELRRKVDLLVKDRNASVESSQSTIKKNKETIRQLRRENKSLHKKLAKDDDEVIKKVLRGPGMEKASFRNMSMKAARTVLEKQMQDKMKKLNAMKHITQKSQKRLGELKRLYKRMKTWNKSARQKQDEDNQKLRILENRLEKTTLKFQEAKHIMQGYLKLKDHLQEKSLTYEPKVEWMEAEVQRQAQALKDLQVVKSKALLLKNAAKAELQLQKEQMRRECREREKILSQYKKQTVQRIAPAEKMERSVRTTRRREMHQDERSSEARRSTTAAFTEAFERIKDATDIKDSQEMVERFISQERLNRMEAEIESVLLGLKQKRDRLQKQLQEMKFSREAEFSDNQRTLQEGEAGLKREQQHCDAAEDRLRTLTETRNRVAAGVQHLNAILELIALTKAPKSQLSSDPDEKMLQLMSEVEQKLILLQEELQGKDLATIMEKLKEEKFEFSVVGKNPAYTPTLLHETQNIKAFADEEDSEEDERDIITRTTLKLHAQAIIDGNTKKNTPLKKRKRRL